MAKGNVISITKLYCQQHSAARVIVIKASTLIFAGAICFILAGAFYPSCALGEDFSTVYAKLKPSVVYVVAATSSGAQSGSGFIYDSDASHSIIVTAYHVVTGAQRIDIILDSDKSKRYQATLLQHDAKRDVAFLRIPVGNRRPLPLEEQPDIVEGKSIAIVGYPRSTKQFEAVEGDALRPSVHMGIISAVRLDGEIVQIDAQSDHGDSGGPVFDTSTGRVVGIVIGTMLDSTYAERGLERPLPGSAYAESAPMIYSVRNDLLRSSPAGAGGSARVSSSSESSAAYRVAFINVTGRNDSVQSIYDTFAQRIREHFTIDSSFYAISSSPLVYGDDSANIQTHCEDDRVNALVFPISEWRFDGNTTTVKVFMLVSDCYGVPFFAEFKTKSENRAMSGRTPEREVTDMGNDLVDQLLSDFDAYRAKNSVRWRNLLKDGIANDAGAPVPAVSVGIVTVDKQYRVRYLRPDGLGAKAGLEPGDVVLSLDGNPISPEKTAFEVSELMNSASTVLVRRPSGDVLIHLRQ